MVTKPGDSQLYELSCGHLRRLKESTAKKGKIYCWACRREVKVGDSIAA